MKMQMKPEIHFFSLRLYITSYVVSIKILLEKQIQSQIFAYTDINTKEEVQLEIKWMYHLKNLFKFPFVKHNFVKHNILYNKKWIN